MDGSHSLPIRSQQFGTQMPQGGHPPHHSITSSARASSVGGTSRPSALAVCRLMTNSNLVDCKNRQLGGLRALEDLTGVDADLTPRVQNIGPIAHQQARFDHLTVGTTGRYPIARRERRKLDAPVDEEHLGHNEEGVGPVAYEGGEGRLDLAAGACIEDLNLQSDGAR